MTNTRTKWAVTPLDILFGAAGLPLYTLLFLLGLISWKDNRGFLTGLGFTDAVVVVSALALGFNWFVLPTDVVTFLWYMLVVVILIMGGFLHWAAKMSNDPD